MYKMHSVSLNHKIFNGLPMSLVKSLASVTGVIMPKINKIYKILLREILE